MGADLFNLESINKEISVVLHDGISDCFSDVIGTSSDLEWSYNWKSRSVLRLIKHATKEKDSDVVIRVGESGILYINVNSIEFMVMPQVM